MNKNLSQKHDKKMIIKTDKHQSTKKNQHRKLQMSNENGW